MEAKLGQIQQKDAEIDRQQRELVRTCDYDQESYFTVCCFCALQSQRDKQLAAVQARLQQLQVNSKHVVEMDSELVYHTICCCRQRWMLGVPRFSSDLEREMLK